MNILMLEDNSTYSRLVAKLEKEHGHDVTRVINVIDADEKLAARDYDLLIVDLNMTTLGLKEQKHRDDTLMGLATGWVWLREVVLKNGNDDKYLHRIIICSAYEEDFKDQMPTEYQKALDYGIEFVPKTDAIDELAASIARRSKS